jgi:hypothetical protein
MNAIKRKTPIEIKDQPVSSGFLKALVLPLIVASVVVQKV